MAQTHIHTWYTIFRRYVRSIKRLKLLNQILIKFKRYSALYNETSLIPHLDNPEYLYNVTILTVSTTYHTGYNSPG